ncbi:TPA: type II toxin-antitoxin system PemK/MazF family toxin [Candidatus Micrarchaeota archaeon]|nr:type II toxin-antitoxin system PemK/MazF family toxin [Candidatus Micrarchaeota archaeon]
MKEVAKGDVWLTNLPGGEGHEQKGRKYAAVLRDIKQMNMAVVVPLTSKPKTENYPYTHLFMPSKENGLWDETFAMVFQIVSLDKSGLLQKAGKLDAKDIAAIDSILKDMLKL